MRIILNELKKIFNIKSLIIIAIGTFLIYKILPAFEIDYFPNDGTVGRATAVYKEMIERYGNSMDEGEFNDYKKWFNEKKEEAEKIIKSNKIAISRGIDTYEEYRNMDIWEDKELNAMQDKIFYTDEDLFFSLQTMESIPKDYKSRNNYKYYRDYGNNEAIKNTLEKITSSGVNKDILPRYILDNYTSLLTGFLLMTLSAIIFSLAPIFTKDRVGSMEYLQYTTKIGRKLFKRKVIAGIIASIILDTFFIILMFILYRKNDTGMFFESNINSLFTYRIYWISLTFKEYIIITVVASYLLSIIVASLTMFISSIAKGYLSLLVIVVPFAIAALIFQYNILIPRILDVGRAFNFFIPKYFIEGMYIFMVIISSIILYLKGKRLKTYDILY